MPASSQLPSDQNNRYAKEAYFGVAYSSLPCYHFLYTRGYHLGWLSKRFGKLCIYLHMYISPGEFFHIWKGIVLVSSYFAYMEK